MLLFATRSLRMFAYGFLAVVLVLYLEALGLDGASIGLLLGLTLLGDAAISLLLTTRADRFGRRRTLFLGSLLMVGAGLAFASTDLFPVLLVAATLGVLSPSGNEVGPFLAIEQASLAQLVDDRRTGRRLFARYQVVGLGRHGVRARWARVSSRRPRSEPGPRQADAYRVVIVGYAVIGLVMAFVFPLLSRRGRGPGRRDPVEAAPAQPRPASASIGPRGIVARLSALFALDAFGGGFVMQGFIAFWLTTHVRRRPGAGRRASCSGPTSWRRSRRWPPGRSRRASGSSGRWCSPTCRRTCC